MKKNLILFCLLVGLIVACQRPSNTQKTEEELKALSCIDDSVEALSPHAFRMIEKGMKSAQDSLAYYEYYIRKAKVYELSTTPDSSVPIVANTIAFANRQPSSPRRNSLLAFAYNLKAVGLHNFRQNPDEVIRLYKEATVLLANSDAKD